MDRVAAARAAAASTSSTGRPTTNSINKAWQAVLKACHDAVVALKKNDYPALKYDAYITFNGETRPCWTSNEFKLDPQDPVKSERVSFSLWVIDDDITWEYAMLMTRGGVVQEIHKLRDLPLEIRQSPPQLRALWGFFLELAKKPGLPVWSDAR